MAEYRVLVAGGKGELARKIAEGAGQAGAAVEFAGEWSEGYDLVFLDALKAHAGIKGNVALYRAKGFLDFGNPMDKAVRTLSQARVVNQITLGKKGLLKSSFDETSLERARAFGERTVRNLSGRRFEKPSDKSRISGYRK